MSKKGDVKRETRSDGKVEVWQLIKIEDSVARERELKDRIINIKKEMETIEDFDDEMVAAVAIAEERQIRVQMKADMEAEIIRIEEMVGD